MERRNHFLLFTKERYKLGNAYYGRRMPSCSTGAYARRTATCGICDEAMSSIAVNDCADMVVAMAYVPIQPWQTLFEVEDGFKRGTVFPDLDKPFMGGACYHGM